MYSCLNAYLSICMRFGWERMWSYVPKCIFGLCVYVYGFCQNIHVHSGGKQRKHLKQKRQKDSDLATGSHGKHKISTIWQTGHQKDASTFQEKLTILDKMQEMGWTQKQTASYYNNKGYAGQVSPTNISCWLKDKEKLVLMNEAPTLFPGIEITTTYCL